MTPSDGVEMNWAQAQDVLTCVEELVGRHARLMAEAPDMSGAADRCAEDAVRAIEGIAEPLARWADALDDWARAAQRQTQTRAALADALIAELLAAKASTPDALRDVVHAALGLAPARIAAAEPMKPQVEAVGDDATDPPPEVSAPAVSAAEEPAPEASAITAAVPQVSSVEPLLVMPAQVEEVVHVEPAPSIQPPDVTRAAAPITADAPSARRAASGPSDSAEMSAAFDFPLHDLDPLADADEEPSLFDFDDDPANDDLSALQTKDLDDVIDATPELEVEDVTMGSLGLMETSALSTDQVRAQLKVIRAERAAAAIAAQTHPPQAVAPDPAPAPDRASKQVGAEAASVAAPTAPGQPATPKTAADQGPFPPLPRRTNGSLIEPSVVEVESGPIDVLDVRQLLGEPPAQPSRMDAAVRAALSSPPDAARAPDAPRAATTDHSDWLEATPTSYPPASALPDPLAGESVEIELDSIDIAGSEVDVDKTVALQSVDLSAAMQAVNAEDWLDASQSVDMLTSNQSLKALASNAEPDADDPWAALDISTHGELKAGRVSQARATRAMLNVSIGVEYCGRFFTARSANISSAGMLVSCEQLVADGERVDLFFEMPSGESIAVQATVCRTRDADQRRIALAFVNLRYDDRVVIDRYVTSKTA